MSDLNGLHYVKKTDLAWHKIDGIIKNRVNCEYISFNEVERCEDSINVSFSILDTSKIKEISESFKKFISEEDLQYVSLFDDLEAIDDNYDGYDLDVDNDIYLGIIESYLNEAYDINIKVKWLEACYEYLGVIFE